MPGMTPHGGWSVGHVLLFGCEPKFAPGTVWVNPLSAETDGYPPIRFHHEGQWWQWLHEGMCMAADVKWFFVGVDKLERFSLLKADTLIKECGIDVREPENISCFLFNFSFKATQYVNIGSGFLKFRKEKLQNE